MTRSAKASASLASASVAPGSGWPSLSRTLPASVDSGEAAVAHMAESIRTESMEAIRRMACLEVQLKADLEAPAEIALADDVDDGRADDGAGPLVGDTGWNL